MEETSRESTFGLMSSKFNSLNNLGKLKQLAEDSQENENENKDEKPNDNENNNNNENETNDITQAEHLKNVTSCPSLIRMATAPSGIGLRRSVTFNTETYVHEFITIPNMPSMDDFFIPTNALDTNDFMNSKIDDHEELVYRFQPKNFSRFSAKSPNLYRTLPSLATAEEEKDKNVSLIALTCNFPVVTGVVKVCNLSFHKQVKVRYSTNKWKTVRETDAAYLTSVNGDIDAFKFSFEPCAKMNMDFAPKDFSISFCICFKCDKTEYWDNNDGKDYVITMLRTKQLLRARTL